MELVVILLFASIALMVCVVDIILLADTLNLSRNTEKHHKALELAETILLMSKQSLYPLRLRSDEYKTKNSHEDSLSLKIIQNTEDMILNLEELLKIYKESSFKLNDSTISLIQTISNTQYENYTLELQRAKSIKEKYENLNNFKSLKA